MVRICKAKRKDGTPCPNAAQESGWCFTHDPAKGAERAAARKKGGQRRRVGHAAESGNLPGEIKTLAGVLALLDYTLRETIPLENSVQRTRALVSIATAFVSVLQAGELEQRVAAIEAALTLTGGQHGENQLPENRAD